MEKTKIQEDLNLQKKTKIDHDIILPVFDKMVEEFSRFELGFDDSWYSIMLTMNNVGQDRFLDITLTWRDNEPYTINILVEEYNYETEEYVSIYEEKYTIQNVNTIAENLINHIDNLIDNSVLLNVGELHEGLNLKKREELSMVKDPLSKSKYYKVGYRVGWVDTGKFRYGTIRSIYRVPNNEIMLEINIDDNPDEITIEMPLSKLMLGR